jgi:hypothetical protein
VGEALLIKVDKNSPGKVLLVCVPKGITIFNLEM